LDAVVCRCHEPCSHSPTAPPPTRTPPCSKSSTRGATRSGRKTLVPTSRSSGRRWARTFPAICSSAEGIRCRAVSPVEEPGDDRIPRGERACRPPRSPVTSLSHLARRLVARAVARRRLLITGVFAAIMLLTCVLLSRRLTESSWPLAHARMLLVAASASSYFVLPAPWARGAQAVPAHRVSGPGALSGVGRGGGRERHRVAVSPRLSGQ